MSRGGAPGPSASASRMLVPPTSATSQGVSSLTGTAPITPLPHRGRGWRAAASRVRVSPAIASVRLWLPGDAALLLLAQASDAEPHLVAGLEVARRLLAHADPGRRAGGDDVAGQQRHEMADVAHQVVDREDHRAGIAVLHALAVDVEPHVEGLRILDLVARHQPWPERGEAVAALALVPGAAALELVG